MSTPEKTRRRNGRPFSEVVGRILLVLALTFQSGIAASGYVALLTGPVILEQPLEYMPENRFPQVGAVIQSASTIRTAKLYFRAEQYPDFYYVEMTRDRDRDKFVAVLPMPKSDTKAVLFFIEVMDAAFQSTRTALRRAKVTDNLALASFFFPGDEPGIILGATRDGAPRIPPGFESKGVVGGVDADGTVKTGGGHGLALDSLYSAVLPPAME